MIMRLVATWMLVSCQVYAQQQPEKKDTVNTADSTILENKGWKDLPTYQIQYDRVVEQVRSFSPSETGSGPELKQIDALVSRANGGDLLTQAVWKGVVTGDVTDAKIVLRLFDRIASASDPQDLPARSRLWNKKSTMLIGLGRILWRLSKNGDLPITEMQQIESDPQKWRARFAPSIPVIAPLTPEKETSELEKSAAPTSLASNPTAQATSASKPLPMVQPGPHKAPSTAPASSTPNEEPASSTPWSIIVVLIVAVTGLLWLLVKKRK